ncbi:hypothetical protein B0A53_01117 [Rhodotorula sp. CCFEE 5036]|nr:hypothetical protein B0A53_01117 [Rhodotorula sp. CCFEE 5036]
MVRLDADLLARTPSYLSPLRDREIDLRGHKIPAIENLAVTRDQLDSIDLTDNQIHALANLPVLKRLSQLLLANNPVRTVSVNLATSLPNLRTLVLTNAAVPKDALAHTAVTLGRCRKLEHLSLKGCPVQHAQHYKDWIIFNCKKLRSLDFERVHLKDREHANSLFLTATGEPTALHTSFLEAAASGSAAAAPSLVSSATGTKTFEPGVEPAERDAGKAGRLLTKEEKDRVRKAIEGAESVEEIRRLQRMLAQGFVPTEKDLRDLERQKTRTNGSTAAKRSGQPIDAAASPPSAPEIPRRPRYDELAKLEPAAHRLAFRSIPYGSPASIVFPPSSTVPQFSTSNKYFQLRCFPSQSRYPDRPEGNNPHPHPPTASLNNSLPTPPPSLLGTTDPNPNRPTRTRKPYTVDLTLFASKKKVHKSAVEEGGLVLQEENVRETGPRKWLLPGYHYIMNITLETYRGPLPDLVASLREALKTLKTKAEAAALAAQLADIEIAPRTRLPDLITSD